jgi:AraC family transcriptional regulator
MCFPQRELLWHQRRLLEKGHELNPVTSFFQGGDDTDQHMAGDEHYRVQAANGDGVSSRTVAELLGEELPTPATGVRVSRLSQSTPLAFTIPSGDDYLLIARMSNRCEVSFDFGSGAHRGEIRYGHMLLRAASAQSSWWLSRPDQTLILRIPEEMFRHAWDNDAGDLWPGIMRMASFRQDSLVTQILARLAAELTRSRSVNLAFTRCLLYQLCTHLVRRYSEAVDVSIKHNGMPPSRLKKVIEFITEHIEDDLSLARMAKVAGISRYYFCREFKKSMGVTPQRYVVQQRIEKAKVLLQSTSLTITEVSAQLRFPTPSHFTSTFRRIVGLTPTSFRM